MDGQRLRIAHWLTALLLAAALLGVWAYVDWVNPAPFYTIKYDPEMPYLLNSLAIFKSHPYAYIDHPGTPVEFVGTLILSMLKAASRLPSDEFVPWVLAHPEGFLRWSHGLLALGSVLSMAAVLFLTGPVREGKDLVWASGAALVFFAVHPPYAFNTLNYWSHNSFSFFGGTLLLMIGVAKLRNPGPLARRAAIGLGVAAGILTAVQLYFFTWVVGIALSVTALSALNTRRVLPALAAGSTTLAAGLAGFFVSTLPVMHRYRELFWWVKGLIQHQGIYGSGPLGVTTFARLASNFSRLWWEGGGLVLASTIAAVVLTGAGMALHFRGKRKEAWWWAVAIGSTFQLLITLFLILKHPAQTYLLALAAILPVSVVLLSQTTSSSTRASRFLLGIGVAILFLGFLQSAVGSVRAHERSAEYAREAKEELDQVLQTYSRDHGRPRDTLVLLWGYGSPSRCFALRFGNTYIEGIFSEEIDRLCPREWIYNVWEGLAELPNGVQPLAESEGWDVLIMPRRYMGENTEAVSVAFLSARTDLVYLTLPGQSSSPQTHALAGASVILAAEWSRSTVSTPMAPRGGRIEE